MNLNFNGVTIIFNVANNEDRHRRDIRTVSDRLFRLLKGHADLFARKRPSRV